MEALEVSGKRLVGNCPNCGCRLEIYKEEDSGKVKISAVEVEKPENQNEKQMDLFDELFQ